MDYTFFQTLNSNDAKLYLQNFLSESSSGFDKMFSDFVDAQITIDYSFESLVSTIAWLSKKIVAIPKEEDDTLSSWIKTSEIYKKGLYSFDEKSRVLILRVSFYMGECFIKSNRRLSWGLGDSDTILANIPVVDGFRGGMQLAPFLVLENLLRRIVQGADRKIIESTLKYWIDLAN